LRLDERREKLKNSLRNRGDNGYSALAENINSRIDRLGRLILTRRICYDVKFMNESLKRTRLVFSLGQSKE